MNPPANPAPVDVFRQAFDHSPAMQSVVRVADERLIEVNNTFLAKLGLAREEVIGRAASELNFWVEPEQLAAFRADLLAHGSVLGRPVRLRARSGEVLTILLSSHVKEIEGQPYLVSAGVDITARQQAEERLRASEQRLRESEERFSTVFHASPILMAVGTLPDGRFVEANPAFLDLFGCTREEVIGRNSAELGLWLDATARQRLYEQILAHGRAEPAEGRVRSRRGTEHTLLVCGERVQIDGRTHLLTFAVDISARKQVEERLRESERRLRESEARFSRAFHANPSTVALTRSDNGKFVSVNKAFLQKTGYTEEEVLGRTGAELALHAPSGQREEYYRQITELGRARDVELVVRAKDGRLHTILASGECCEIDGVPHVLTVGVDITARQQAQAELGATLERLRQSEERFGKAFRSNPAMVVLTRLTDGRFMAVNEAFVRATGYAEAELLGRTAVDLALHAFPEQRTAFLQRINEQGSMRDFELVLRTKSAELRTLLASGERCDIDGVPHVLTVGLDITDRKVAEAKLRENEQRLRDSEAQVRALYDGISTAVLVQDEDGFLLANRAAMDLMGVKGRVDFVGKRPPDFSAPVQAGGEGSAVASKRHMERALAEGRAEFEWICRRLDGSLVPVAVTLTPLQLGGRTVLQSVVLDLTERKRAETELQKALEQERELNQLKTDFVSIVSHEFRTPLEIIMSSVDNLDRYHDRLPPEKRTELHRMINKSVRRMAGMMEEVLLLGRLGPGGTELQPTGLDLAALGTRVRDEMQSATGHRCPITLRCEGTLAGAQGDEAVLRHIVTNLLSNAVKYSDEGRPVELALRRDGPAAVIRVADQGCGIPAADQPRLFQAFHRGGNVRQIPGTGLGLLIVRRSVDLHGGEISFESTEGRGTTWTVRLPLFG